MAWAAPRTWSVSEVVTASIMNTHVRDNLKYLKGQAGTIAFEAGATFVGTVAPSPAAIAQIAASHNSGPHKAYIGETSTGVFLVDINRHPDTAVFDDTGKSHARILMDCSGAASAIGFNTASAANTFGTERMRITGAGNIGIGTSAPQGPLHIYGAIAGWMYWEFDGVDGTLRTIIPNGAGDVVYGLVYSALVRTSAGTVIPSSQIGGTALTPGTSNDLDSGAGTLTLAVAADGSVTIQRTAGALTYKVSLLLQWL